jgi:hypothetical protein
MANRQNRKSLKKSSRGRRRGRGGKSQTRRRRPAAADTKNNLFDWSSVVPRASIKTKTRFNLKNDWGLRIKGNLNI